MIEPWAPTIPLNLQAHYPPNHHHPRACYLCRLSKRQQSAVTLGVGTIDVSGVGWVAA